METEENCIMDRYTVHTVCFENVERFICAGVFMWRYAWFDGLYDFFTQLIGIFYLYTLGESIILSISRRENVIGFRDIKSYEDNSINSRIDILCVQ